MDKKHRDDAKTFANMIAFTYDMDPQDVQFVVRKFVELMKTNLIEGNEVVIRGFGRFKVKVIPGRIRWDFVLKKKVPQKPSATVTFRCSKAIREVLNGKKFEKK